MADVSPTLPGTMPNEKDTLSEKMFCDGAQPSNKSSGCFNAFRACP